MSGTVCAPRSHRRPANASESPIAAHIMVTIVVIAHRPLASALVEAARHVYSRDPCAASRQMVAMDVSPDADIGSAIEHASELLREVDRGQGVLVLTDVTGATPGNVATQLAQPGRVAVVSGVNLPMLLRSLCYGASSLDELVAKATAGGVNGVQQLVSASPNSGVHATPTAAPAKR
jgi:PTS system ascorbate-specific IIA component